MTDKELLELAAKAAGFGAPKTGRTCWTESEYPRNSEKYGALWNYVGHMDTAELWNPLTDDGDALRLAVQLKIDVKHYDDYVVGWFDGGYIGTGKIMYEGDPYAATRRAITRAAAAIGEGMP